MKARSRWISPALLGASLALAGAATPAAESAPATAAEPLDEALYARILERHTVAVSDTAGTRVDYPALARSAEWRQLIRNLAQTDPQALGTRQERLAYWINVYNILAIDVVTRNQPLDSIKDVGSLFSPVWKREAGRIAGQPYTLHQVEHEILRPMGDPRIHVAIVCASTSCPSLRREPFTATRVDAQLDDSFRGFVANRTKGLAIDRGSESVRLSKIFDWFEEDFESRGGVLAVVRKYVSDADRAWLEAHPNPRVGYFDYDWRVNAVRS